MSEPRKIDWLRVSLPGLVVAGVLLSAALAAWAGPPAAPRASAEEAAADKARFVAAGAKYSPQGFPEFPNRQTPFPDWRGIHTGRLSGKEVYVSIQGKRIWKALYCGRPQEIYLQLSLMNRRGVKIPFAWQRCNIYCGDAGFCGPENPLYIDITGEGKPEIKFESLKRIIKIEKSFFRNPRFYCTVDILPAWLKRAVGPDFKRLSTIGPGDSVGYWQDHPLGVKSDEGH